MEKQKYVVRSNGSGVWAGEIKERTDNTVIMTNARRIHYWDGAASLSELAMRGVSKPHNCRFPCKVGEVEIFNILEIIKMTDKAWDNMESVPIWTK